MADPGKRSRPIDNNDLSIKEEENEIKDKRATNEINPDAEYFDLLKVIVMKDRRHKKNVQRFYMKNPKGKANRRVKIYKKIWKKIIKKCRSWIDMRHKKRTSKKSNP